MAAASPAPGPESSMMLPSTAAHPDSMTEIVIRPNQSWCRLSFNELLSYKDLLWLLVWRDFVAKYKQTVLGPLWFIIQPLLTTLVFTVIFGKVAQIPTEGIPPVLFYLCGLLGWNYFALTFNAASTTFTANAHLFGKVYFPRLVVPLSFSISNLASLALNLLVFAGFWLWFRFGTESFTPALNPTATLLLPLLILQTAIISLACGLWMAALTAKYRDLTHLTSFLVQLWLYATPVIYPLSQISERWQWVAALNPMAAVVESFRYLLLGTSAPPLQFLALSVIMGLVLLISSVLIFNRTERRFIDTV